ncbi:hypothetical protein GCM10010970_22640 [Silvimonas iriomotensis]|uniref:SF3 helicase domain-containing protein n=2 Tax=Silvimonas iriomotensis TaxID=449662 RepID=A0ABQ2P9R9_9NEIS|nr:hypothetical protein GCM10010970_22640 [Silvimonas iriomotensis]
MYKEIYRWLVQRDPAWASKENVRRAYDAATLFAEGLPLLASGQVVLPARNGYIHLDDNHNPLLHPADPRLGLTYVLGCDFDPDNREAPIFTSFLEEVLPDCSIRERVQEYVGYTLLGDTRFQRAQFWLGTGANGKGVLANIVQALHQQVRAASLTQLSNFQLSGLLDASLIYVDEVARKPIDEQLLKSMIAGELVHIDRKYQDPVSARILGKWLVLGNQLPVVSDQSTGFWRRWDFIPFAVTIPEAKRDPKLGQRIIDNELSAVLNWAIEGLTRLLQRGRFDPEMPAGMTALLHDAQVNTDSVAAWISDCDIGIAKGSSTLKSAVFDHYHGWCKTNVLAPCSGPQFWKRIEKQLPGMEKPRPREGGVQQRKCNISLP